MSGVHANAAPGSRRPRRKPGENRASLLLAGGIEFARYGYAATQTSAIASRAGVSQPNVYANFASKEDLFLECLRIALSRIELSTSRQEEQLAPVHACLLYQAIACLGLREVGEAVRELLLQLLETIGTEAFEATVLQGQAVLLTTDTFES